MIKRLASEKSELFCRHSNWILGHKRQDIGRNQYVLNLRRQEVCDYIYESVAWILRSAEEATLHQFGSLVNMISPVRLRPGSAVHALPDHVVKFPEKAAKITTSGQMFLPAGFYPQQQFSGTGYMEGTRVMQDWDSRLYYWKEG